MYCTEDCKCSLCRELRGFDYRKDCERKRVTPKDLKNNKDHDGGGGSGNGNFSMMKKAKSSFELAPKPLDIKFKNNTPTKYPSTADLAPPQDNKHKVVIYFSDAYNNICKPIHSQMSSSNNDIDHAKRLVSEMETKQLPTIAVKTTAENASSSENKDFLKQLKTVLQEKSKFTNKFNNLRPAPQPPIKQQITPKPPLAAKPNVVKIQQTATLNEQSNHETFTNTKLLPSYIESIENNVINLKIEQNFKKASELVNLISSLSKKVKRKSDTSAETSSVHELNFSQEDDEENDEEEDEESDDDTASEPAEGYYYDWSFVQEWRSRPLKRTANVATNKLTKTASTAAALKATTTITSNGQSYNKHQMLSHNNSDHLIHSESHHQAQHQLDNRHQLNDKRVVLATASASGLNKMQSQQPITSIGIPKIAKEVVLRSSNGHGSGVIENNVISSQQHHSQQQQQQHHSQQQQQQPQHHQQQQHQRHSGNDIKSPINHFGSPPRIQCVSSSMIPERDFGPARLPASPPTITQSTPLSATIVQPNYKPIPQRATRLTVQSTPVKTLPALISSGLNKTYLQHNNHPSPMHHNTSNTSNNNHNVSKIIVSNDMDDKSKHHHPIPSSSSSSSLSNTGHIAPHINKPLPPPIHGPMLHPMSHQYHPQSPPQNIGVSANPQGLQPQALKPKSTINVTRTHHHGGGGSLDFQGFHKINECQSSSDENRSSGHASMSDTGHGSSSPGSNKTGNGQLVSVPEDRLAAGVTNRNGRSRASTGHTKPRHRATPAKIPWSGNGLEDIKLAIQQLTLRSQTSTSTYSSLSAGSESSEPARRLGRYSSMETVNTNVTSADEFVWVDSHNRLVELQHPPWSQYCLMRVIRTGRCRDIADRVSAEAVPRLGYLLTRALVRISREIQRLSSVLSLCSKHEVSGAFKMVLAPALSDSCIKACLRSAAMFAISGDGALKQTKSARAGLQLPVGRFHRWMVDARLGKLVHEYAAVYLCAGFENLLEEILLQSMPSECTVSLTAMGLEHAIANSGDLWGLLQPFVHLNAGRIASGALTMPRWTSQTSVVSNQSAHSKQQEPCLLTTCVGSLAELKDLVNRSQKRSNHITMSQAALRELFYFMRCSQLEHNNEAPTTTTNATTNATTSNTNIQELCYERAYIVLPPLIEWLRVASAHSDYRHSTLIDRNDIIQAARLLLPGVDCPPRQICCNEELPSAKVYTIPSNVPYHNQGSISSSSSNSNSTDEFIESGRRATIDLGFRLMLTGIPELLVQAMSLVPPTTRYDTLNHQGLTALMLAALRNDETAIQTLLDSGANPNIEVPAIGCPNCPAIHPETQHWTAVTFASCRGNYTALRVLLERGGKVEGGARLSEEKCTLTPLQVASGSGCIDIVSLLLAHGASSFLSTKQNSMSFSGAQRGCYSAISVATAHGQRLSLRKLLSHPFVPEKRDVLSLEEMLAEGDNNTRSVHDRQNEAPPTLTKQQIRTLQEAMYHSAENNYLDITIELRALGVPWTLHCWMHALAAAHELRLDTVIDQLLQDFLQVCPDDYSQQFVMECLPLLFNIFRYSKKEGTTLLLADIFSTCFAWEPIKPIKETVLQPVNGSRIDPKFVNNPELSDVTFRVEGKIFYGHKIVLVTASPRLQSLLSSKVNEGNGTPTVQINDIRYHIFELVMQYLYCGGCNNMDVVPGDVLELMAAASFFQLEGLLRYTEARCAEIIDIDNVVAMYIHAKVYNASKLMEYCQGFLLQNMVALLTYDDSVKRLLFAKKIPNHDVLSGLLTTLQQRIKTRRSISQNMPQQPPLQQQQQQQQQHQQQNINNNNNHNNSSNSIVKPVPIIANSNHNNSTNALLNKSNNNLNNNSQIE